MWKKEGARENKRDRDIDRKREGEGREDGKTFRAGFGNLLNTFNSLAKQRLYIGKKSNINEKRKQNKASKILNYFNWCKIS